jgi:hypothetical protein
MPVVTAGGRAAIQQGKHMRVKPFFQAFFRAILPRERLSGFSLDFYLTE